MKSVTGAGIWQYHLPIAEYSVEGCIVQGRQVGLPPHFHDEDQLVLVLKGRRRFLVADQVVEAHAGETLHIAAGVVHSSLAEERDLLCVNLYLRYGCWHIESLCQSLTQAWAKELFTNCKDVISVARACLHKNDLDWQEPRPLGPLHIRPDMTVAEAAFAHGVSREHYSRIFRQHNGVSPQQHRLMQRLNIARVSLRNGVGIAVAASAAGFTDQSHLTHTFKRYFGVSPRRYFSGSLAADLPDRLGLRSH